MEACQSSIRANNPIPDGVAPENGLKVRGLEFFSIQCFLQESAEVANLGQVERARSKSWYEKGRFLIERPSWKVRHYFRLLFFSHTDADTDTTGSPPDVQSSAAALMLSAHKEEDEEEEWNGGVLGAGKRWKEVFLAKCQGWTWRPELPSTC